MLGLNNWWRNRVLERERAKFDPQLRDDLRGALPLLSGLTGDETRALNDLALLYMREKTFEQARGMKLDDGMCLVIALQACLPILKLGLDWYRGWCAVIVYPEEFVPEREWVDEDGVVWVANEPMSGEAWEQGPVILSWADVEGGLVRDGYNLVVHEHAHKLDMRNGVANGHPPLHAGMSDSIWSEIFTQAYEDMTGRVDDGEETPIDPYATESPAEFFAVCSETFFELPNLLYSEYPRVYAQLRGFYRQDPMGRLPPLAPPRPLPLP